LNQQPLTEGGNRTDPWDDFLRKVEGDDSAVGNDSEPEDIDDLREAVPFVVWVLIATAGICGFAFGLLCGKVGGL
jgi:hypothetical protein